MGNNMGASNDAGEREGWLKAGTGDDKTGYRGHCGFLRSCRIYNRDRFLSTNADTIRWGGFDDAVQIPPEHRTFA